MSTEQRQITLTENDDGRWTAQEEPTGLTARGDTPEAALNALDESDDTQNEDTTDSLDELMQATEDITLTEDDLDAMIRDSKSAWSSLE